MINKKIGIIGCGNMGEAILSRLSNILEKSTSIMVSEYDTARRDYIQNKYKIIVEIDNNAVVKYSDVIILAVKPKDFDKILKTEVCCGVSKSKILISIAAGITTKHIEGIVGKDIPVIRVMPNMPAVIGEAISSISRGTSAGDKEMDVAKEIFSVIGEVVEVDEKLVDAVTAVSGSGPAYFFYLIEALVEASRKLGLDEETAKKLVLKTAIGSAKLLEATKEEPHLLRKKVTSKGGTTEAALKVFDDKMVKSIIRDAVKAAHKRSKELTGG
ncbi:MAG: pyrroline-5-carboxylate reductase [Candidatus Omnitrophota bacterium]|nr:pyrroline-5-carboxylate reductase [Candidatus Omnitrophota bacterium]